MRGVARPGRPHEHTRCAPANARRLRRATGTTSSGDVVGDDEDAERGQVAQPERDVGGARAAGPSAAGATGLGHGVRIGSSSAGSIASAPGPSSRASGREHRRRVRRVAEDRDVADPGAREGEHQRVAVGIVAGPPDDLDAGAG